MPRLLKLLIIFAVLSTVTVVAAQPAGAAPNTVIVAPNGNDANPGTLARPKATIQAAMRELPRGGTIELRGGDYTIRDGSGYLYQGGTARRPLVVRSWPGERARLTSAPGNHCVGAGADHIVIRNIDCTGAMGIGTQNASHVVITGNYIHDLTEPRTQGIMIAGEGIRRIRVVRNTIARVPQTGIAVGQPPVRNAFNIVVKRNTVREANLATANPHVQTGWGSGISVIASVNARIIGNDVRNTYGEGINCPLSNRCKVKRNTVVNAYNALFYADNTTNSVWENNVGWTTGDPRFSRNYGSGAFQANGFQMANENSWFSGPINPTNGNVVRNNKVTDVNNGFIFGSYENGAAGIRNTHITNNVFHGTRCGIQIEGTAVSTGNLVAGNKTTTGRHFCGVRRGVRFR